MPLPALATLLRCESYSPSPLELRATLWLDAKRSDVIFTSNAGSGAISDGAAAGYWGDISGNALHMTSAADDTTRPTWTDNSGNSYMAFDGTNDLLRRTSTPGMYASLQSSTFVTIANASTPATGAALFGEGNSGGGNSFYYPIAVNATTGTTYRALSNDTGASNIFNGPNIANVYTAAPKVIGFVDNGGSLVIYINGVQAGFLNYTRGGVTVDRLSLGGFLSNAASAWCSARTYELVMFTRALNPREAAGLSRYLCRRSGI